MQSRFMISSLEAPFCGPYIYDAPFSPHRIFLTSDKIVILVFATLESKVVKSILDNLFNSIGVYPISLFWES